MNLNKFKKASFIFLLTLLIILFYSSTRKSIYVITNISEDKFESINSLLFVLITPEFDKYGIIKENNNNYQILNQIGMNGISIFCEINEKESNIYELIIIVTDADNEKVIDYKYIENATYKFLSNYSKYYILNSYKLLEGYLKNNYSETFLYPLNSKLVLYRGQKGIIFEENKLKFTIFQYIINTLMKNKEFEDKYYKDELNLFSYVNEIAEIIINKINPNQYLVINKKLKFLTEYDLRQILLQLLSVNSPTSSSQKRILSNILF